MLDSFSYRCILNPLEKDQTESVMLYPDSGLLVATEQTDASFLKAILVTGIYFVSGRLLL